MSVIAPRKDRLVVAAIDFGTTYSGYAFSFQDQFAKDPLKIITNQNWIGSSLMSQKTASCLLLKPNQTLDSFGFEAENSFAELCMQNDGSHKKYFFFRQFKMILHNSKELSRRTKLVDELGKSLPAQKVFSIALAYMKDHLMKLLTSQRSGINDDDIHWVVTVPAIWDDNAKQFMREAAIGAGIKHDAFSIALEPEAASMYCQMIPTELVAGQIAVPGPGHKYMVLDLGGGTVDITVHEKLEDNRLRALHTASGGAWGGTEVDKKFQEMLRKIVGKDFMQKFQKENVGDMFEIYREFETKKRMISPEKTNKITLNIPVSLMDMYKLETKKEIKDAVTEAYGENIKHLRDKIRVNNQVFKDLFQQTIDSIVCHVDELLRDWNLAGLDTILMVGGFSECLLVIHAIKTRFPNKKVIVPPDAGLAVLKGAVIYGHQPQLITSRITKYTYGFEAWPTFQQGVHPESKRSTHGSSSVCKEVFQKYVEKNREVQVNDPITVKHRPANQNQKEMEIKIYISTETDPKFVTDRSCRFLGNLKIPLLSRGSSKSGQIEGRMMIGDAELYFQAKDMNTGKIYEATFDCL